MKGGMWKMNVDEVLSELGLGILRNHKQNDPIERDLFMDKWREAVGDTFADRVELRLIAVRVRVHALASGSLVISCRVIT